MSVTIVFQQMASMFVMMIVGFFLARKGIFSTHAPSDFSKIIAEVCNPALLICSALEDNSGVSEGNLLRAVIVAIIYYIFLLAMGRLLPRAIKADKGEVKFYKMLCVYGNIGFMGIPLIYAVMGSPAVVYLSIFIVAFNLLVYTHGIEVITSGEREGASKFEWKRMLNSGTVTSIIAIIIFLAKVSIPVAISDSLDYIGRCTSFLSMAVIGMALAQIPFRELFLEARLYVFTALRFLLLPIMVAICLKPLIEDKTLLGVTVLTLALPSANLPLMLAKRYDIEAELLAKGIVLTTLLSVITVTVASWMLT